jgi:holo-[acyl-carrier protein] synthase
MRPVGVGTHIVECLRIAQLIERHGELFLRRVYTAREIEHCSSNPQATQQYAAHWCGKEAVLRALGLGFHGGMTWRDIEIRPEGGTRHTVALAGLAREACATQGISQLLVSLSHCRTHATAYAVALNE